MNEQEAKTLVEKIMHADKVIHFQQLNVPWRPPADNFFSWLWEKAGTGPGEPGQPSGDGASYNGAASATQGNSMIQQNTSVMDSNPAGAQKEHTQSRSDIDEQSQATASKNQHADTKEKYDRIKAVFRLLIDEAEYLIDDRSFERCQGVSVKEQFSIKIDSIRKSLGIDNMEDVELLVDTLYGYEARHKQLLLDEKKKEELEFIEANQAMGNLAPLADDIKKLQDNSSDSEVEPEDPNQLNLDPDHLTAALALFHKTREDRAVENEINAPSKAKKKSNFETEEQKAERQKRKQQIYWEKMTTILSSQKLSVWKALDKALSKYYQMLVERQNLIEETGLLNQQNEELKTLLNQYLQAGVN